MNVPGEDQIASRSWSETLAALLVRRWKTAAGITGACAAVAIAVASLQTPVYEASVSISVGKIARLGASYQKKDPDEKKTKPGAAVVLDPPASIEHPEDVLNRLRARSGASRGGNAGAYLYDARRASTGPATIEILTRGASRADVLALAERTAREIVAAHTVVFEEYRSGIQRMGELAREASEATIAWSRNDGERAAPRSGMEQAALSVLRSLFEERVARAEQLLSPSFAFPTSVLKAAHSDDQPIMPRPVHYLAIALFVGIILSFMAAIGSEWIAANVRPLIR